VTFDEALKIQPFELCFRKVGMGTAQPISQEAIPKLCKLYRFAEALICSHPPQGEDVLPMMGARFDIHEGASNRSSIYRVSGQKPISLQSTLTVQQLSHFSSSRGENPKF
jgi:hypothetical protein